MSVPVTIEPEAIEAVYLTMRAHVVRQPGSRLEWGELYERMVSDWTALCPWSEEPCIARPTPSAAAFAAALAHVCRRTGIQAKAIGAKAYCLDLALRPLTLPACTGCPYRQDKAPEMEEAAPTELWAMAEAASAASTWADRLWRWLRGTNSRRRPSASAVRRWLRTRLSGMSFKQTSREPLGGLR